MLNCPAALDQPPTLINPQINAVFAVPYDELFEMRIDSFDIERLANLVKGFIEAHANIPHQMKTGIQ
jgi:hypothetical protein